jgi:hypothetical protein
MAPVLPLPLVFAVILAIFVGGLTFTNVAEQLFDVEPPAPEKQVFEDASPDAQVLSHTKLQVWLGGQVNPVKVKVTGLFIVTGFGAAEQFKADAAVVAFMQIPLVITEPAGQSAVVEKAVPVAVALRQMPLVMPEPAGQSKVVEEEVPVAVALRQIPLVMPEPAGQSEVVVGGMGVVGVAFKQIPLVST